VSQEKCTNFETVQLEIMRIDFDDICQKYSKGSRIDTNLQTFRHNTIINKLTANEVLRIYYSS